MARRFNNEYRLPHDGSLIRPNPYGGMFPPNNMQNPFRRGPQSPYDWRSPDGDEPKEGGSSVARNPKPKKPSGSSGKKVGV